MGSPEPTLAEVTWRQNGAFSVEQANAAGLTEDQIRYRVQTGEWIRPAPGLLLVAGTPDTWERLATLALLVRPDGVLSHLAAGRALGLVDGTPPIELTVPRGSNGRSRLARLHRADLDRADTTTVGALRCTVAARTIVDVSTTMGPRRLRRLVDEAISRHLAGPEAVLRAVRADPRLPRSTTGSLLAALAVWQDDVRPGSIGEARLLRQIAEWGLPTPERQIVVRNADGMVVARIDIGWSARRLGLEYDGIEWHGPAGWATDEARHALLADLGWTILRVDALDLRPASPFRLRLMDRFEACAPRPPEAA